MIINGIVYNKHYKSFSYLNPGTKGFRENLNSEIYVDKTDLIEKTNAVLNTRQKFLCVSRPRRLGKATKDDILTLLVHLGYLTYDSTNETVSIPNKEVSQEYINAISTMNWHGVADSVESSRKLLEAIIIRRPRNMNV